LKSRIPSGIDPAFPFLDVHERIEFPAAQNVPGDEPALYGANLSPGVLLSAYEQGFFPWYSDDDPLWWWSPDPRFVIKTDQLHVSESMRKVLKKKQFEIRYDTNFEAVIRACSKAFRSGQNGTWIVEDMINAYCKLHELGHAHSAEAYLDGRLVGGLYGVCVGLLFCGESMFADVPNASKAAFLTLSANLKQAGVALIDSQVHTNHLESLGAAHIPRAHYLSCLTEARARGSLQGVWTSLFA